MHHVLATWIIISHPADFVNPVFCKIHAKLAQRRRSAGRNLPEKTRRRICPQRPARGRAPRRLRPNKAARIRWPALSPTHLRRPRRWESQCKSNSIPPVALPAEAPQVECPADAEYSQHSSRRNRASAVPLRNKPAQRHENPPSGVRQAVFSLKGVEAGLKTGAGGGPSGVSVHLEAALRVLDQRGCDV